jgi:DNA replication protein DnaC
MNATKQTPRANAAAREAVIAEYLKALKLPAFATEYPVLVRQATEGGWDYEDFLRELLEMELRSREERTAKRRLKEARFPDVKTLEQLDWESLKGVSRQKIMELATCEFLEAAAEVIIAGRSERARLTWRSLSG